MSGNFQETLAPTVDHETPVVQTNPEFASEMTLGHWKLYNADETLDMYQKAEYLYHKDQRDINDNKVLKSAAEDNLAEA